MPPLSQIEAPQLDLARNQELKMKRPVFVIGSPRPGTTFLYHLPLSAGGFVVYHMESKTFDLLAPRFGKPHLIVNRQRMLDRAEENAHSLSPFRNSKLSMKANRRLGQIFLRTTPWDLWN
jgi:hypothetical protein